MHGHLLEGHRGQDRGVERVVDHVLDRDCVHVAQHEPVCGRESELVPPLLRVCRSRLCHGHEPPHLVAVEVSVSQGAELERYEDRVDALGRDLDLKRDRAVGPPAKGTSRR